MLNLDNKTYNSCIITVITPNMGTFESTTIIIDKNNADFILGIINNPIQYTFIRFEDCFGSQVIFTKNIIENSIISVKLSNTINTNY